MSNYHEEQELLAPVTLDQEKIGPQVLNIEILCSNFQRNGDATITFETPQRIPANPLRTVQALPRQKNDHHRAFL